MTDADLVSRQEHAVLIHGADSAWRRAQRDALLAAAANCNDTESRNTPSGHALPMLPIRVLLSSREAEAAKWFVDPRLSLIVARDDDAAFRHALTTLGDMIPVLWVSARDADDAESVAEVARAAIARLRTAATTRRP